MSDRPEPHSPDPPVISVADLGKVLGQLSSSWLIGIGDPESLHIFDESGQPRGFIDITSATVVMTDGIDDES